MAGIRRVWNLLRQRRLADEIDEELRFHIESSIRANIDAGMSPADARLDALRRFGTPASVRDRARDADLFVFADSLRQDVGFALRSLRKRPAFAVVALLTMALGLGASTAIFTVVRSVLLRPLPFPEPHNLHVISHGETGPAVWLYPGLLDREYLAFKEATRTYESMTTFSNAHATLTGAGDATRLQGAEVTTDFFHVLAVGAAAGRTLAAGDDRRGNEKIVVVSDSLWRTRFSGDPGLVNRTITLDGVPHRVVGILPPGFSYPAGAVFWTSLTVQVNPNLVFSRPVIGRVKAGVTREQAQADLDAWLTTVPADPSRSPDAVARVTPLHEAMVGDVRQPLWIFGGAVAFVLLIASANVANLLLMRAVSRRQEIATRLALGASRARLARQLLTESAVLAVAGGLGGVLLALFAGPALLALVPPNRLPQDLTIRMDGSTIAFTLLLSLVTGLIVGLAPLAQTATDAYGTLRETTAAPTRQSRQLREILVVAEVALALVLLVGAGLLVRSFVNLRAVPLGFAPERVMTMTVDLPVARYPGVTEVIRLHRQLLSSLVSLPNVSSAGAVNWVPLGDMMIGGDVQADDRPDLVGKYQATKAVVSPGYFTTMRIPVVRGRDFTDRDIGASAPVLIVSESVARRFWPDSDPIGKRVSLQDNPTAHDWLTVVGVVQDVRQEGLRTRPAHAVYRPYAQVTGRFSVGYMTFVVRTDGDPAHAAPLMRSALSQVDPSLAPQSLLAMERMIDRKIAEPKFHSRALSVFSLTALLLAAIGVYGVLASSVLERRVEIGIRMALGADSTSVVRMVLRRSLVLTGIGIALGLAGSLAVTGALSRFLFNVTPTDLPSFAVASGILVASAVAAALLPARRASAIDPLTALRSE
jgi:putative ABC transport system permease protein